jgi:peptidoglycan/xylan/chitin deacetylase (PgdA/CDA1 family)
MKIKKKGLKSLYILVILLSLFFLPFLMFLKKVKNKNIEQLKSGFNLSTIVTPTPTPTPTPRPLTFSEMNTLYGPCVYVPTLMYHHVQSPEDAKAKNQTGLTVRTADFRAQMQYLKDRGYSVISMQDLLNFFEQGIKPSSKSALLTFDDGYSDFYLDVYPILREFNYPATVFVPTGLMNNIGYLYWDKIAEMTSGRILFANHTWSHKNVAAKQDVLKTEISTADVQLNEKGLNIPKVFAYPYGLESSAAISFLQGLNYKLAFTTRPGGTLCKKQMLDLPRIRIGNSSLSIYGL